MELADSRTSSTKFESPSPSSSSDPNVPDIVDQSLNESEHSISRFKHYSRFIIAMVGFGQNKVGSADSTFKQNNLTNDDIKSRYNDADPINHIDNVMLDSNRIRMIKPYFSYSTVISHSISDYYEGNVRRKLDNSYLMYDKLLLYFAWFFCFRNLLLAFIDDVEIRGWLGETTMERPQRQLVMVYTILSVYVALVIKNFTNPSNKKNWFTWLSQFQILRGKSTTQTFGIDKAMLDSWYRYTLSYWRRYFLLTLWIILNVCLFFVVIARLRWNSYNRKSWFNYMQIFWTVVNILWTYFAATLCFVCFVYFNSLCFYFQIRFQKVNNDIETIITQRLKSSDRVAMLHHILVEHNELCLKVAEYNQFWAKYLMSTYFFLIATICFSAFQAFFTTNTIYVRFVMFMIFLIGAFVITWISFSAAIMSNTAHAPYNRLIRVTFDKYPVELQIQLRMFIQRTSGPTIGFYCLDVFEITYTTYASILAALGQNFLLIVDFVRSYAEVGREYHYEEFSDFESLTKSVFNSTLDVLEDMTGSHISTSLNNQSFLSIINHQ